MLLALVAAAATQTQLPVKWYGPVTVTFNVQVSGNPYDPEANDLIVRFVPDKGPAVERLAYVDLDGSIKATLVTNNAARYRAILMRNGKQMVEEPLEGFIDVKKPLAHGFIRTNPRAINRFAWDDGTPYYPIGFNLGWQSGDNFIPMRDQIAKMSTNGINWTRIWSSSWDSKNPWWPQEADDKTPKGELWPTALEKWETLVQACDQVDLPYQFVFHNHGSFSSTVNPNWPDHPWNAKKGGFLKDAADFFTDKEAKRRTKMWLRYAVARYGHSPNLMAWELFNEVEWVDARYANRWPDIENWHKEMAEYLRSIDPYKHLITTSSPLDRPALWTAMDYYQPHTYPSNVTAAIGGQAFASDKPGFFGEFGPPGSTPEATARGVRDGIYAAMLMNHAGAAEYWYWDAVEKQNMYPIFRTASIVLKESGLATRPGAKPLALNVSTPGTASLVFGPGGGWQKAEKMSFNLPAETTPGDLAKLPAYLQSLTGNNKALFPDPLTFRFSAPKAGVFKLTVGQISKGGADVKVFVNDREVAAKAWPGAATETNVSDVLEAPFQAGANVIRVENRGTDWANIRSFEFTELAPQVNAMALGESDWMMMRVTRAAGVSDLPEVTVGGLSIGEGPHELIIIDLEKGDVTPTTVQITSGGLKSFRMPCADAMLVFRRKV